jgi:hypothetical protein
MDGAQDRETAADRGRIVDGDQSLVVDDLPQGAARDVGGDQQVARVLAGAELAQQALAHDEELGQRLGGLARLGDHVEDGSPEVDAIEQRGERPRVDVVGDDHLDAAAVALPTGSQRAGERTRPDRGTADAQHDEVVAVAAHALGEGERLLHRLALVGQVEEGAQPLGALRLQVGDGGGEARRQRLELGRRDPRLGADRRVAHPVQIDGEIVLVLAPVAYRLRHAPRVVAPLAGARQRTRPELEARP